MLYSCTHMATVGVKGLTLHNIKEEDAYESLELSLLDDEDDSVLFFFFLHT